VSIRRPRTTVVGLVALAVVAAGLVSRYLPFTNRVVIASAALLPFAIIAGAISVALLVFARRPVLAGVAAVVTASAVATQVPLYIGEAAPAGRELRVMSINVMRGSAHPDEVVGIAEAVDVLAVQELSQDALDGLAAAGLDRAFPYRVTAPRDDAYGIGLWSRFPITETRPMPGYRVTWQTARIQMPDSNVSPVVAVAYLPNPIKLIDAWGADIERVPTTLRELDEWARGAPVIVAGDFNSTVDMRRFRDALAHGYRDAAEQAGAGWAPTFLGGAWYMVSLFAIDHVLTLRCNATHAHTVDVKGTDHRALVVTVAI
jgi:endonuclease/exonuclease/phosphatase (EEP) superfamily protein YafD